MTQANAIDHDADRQTTNFARANSEYQQVAKSFPQMEVTPEHLKGAVLALDPLAMRPLTPEPLMIQISGALLAAPGFVLARLDWRIAASADEVPGAPARPRAPVTGAGAPAANDRYEIAVLTGTLTAERSATPRRKIAAARAAVDALRRIPGIEVTPVRLPLDVSPTGNLKGGDEATATSTEGEPVILRLVRKVVP